MGYLNNTVVTVDAVLTKKGRELLARGDGSFRITQFALSDDEVDYNLFNPNHSSGSAFYGQAIENMPILEAFPDETQSLKYKLLTLPRGTARLPLLANLPALSDKQGTSATVRPQTLNYSGQSTIVETGGYVFTIADARLTSVFSGIGIDTEEARRLNSTTTFGTNISKSVIGTGLNLTLTTVNTLFGSNTALTTTVYVVGRDSGARGSFTLTVNKLTT